jgi:hypothetical protein
MDLASRRHLLLDGIGNSLRLEDIVDEQRL